MLRATFRVVNEPNFVKWYILLNNVGQLPFFFKNKHTHTQGRGKVVLTQKHTTIPLKSHDTFYRRVG